MPWPTWAARVGSRAPPPGTAAKCRRVRRYGWVRSHESGSRADAIASPRSALLALSLGRRVQKTIEQPGELRRPVELDPMPGAVHHSVREPSDPVQAEG